MVIGFRVGVPDEKCFGAHRVRPSEHLRLLGELRRLSLTVAMRMCVSPPPGDRERGPGPGASPPEDPGASPGGVELVMSPQVALREVGSRESSAGGLCRAGLARREAGWTASRWARITQSGNWPAPDSARTASGPTTRASQIPAPSHPVSACSARTCLDPRERLPGIRSRGSGDDLATRAARPVRRRGRGSRRGPSWPPARPTRTSSSTPAREPARARRRDFGLDNTHPIYVITTKPLKFIQRAHGGALLFGPSICGWTTVVQPSFSRVECASRGPGCSGAGRRGPRDRRVTAEHVT